jgi:hypothetical protein
MVGAPLFVIFAHIAIADFGGSLLDCALHVTEDLCSHLPRWDTPTSIAYVVWFLTQAALYLCCLDLLGPANRLPRATF